jgi:eukaryotic-like serine/threonine-protein kinase
MPRVPKSGDNIKGYTIKQHLSTGAMANAFAARSPDGMKVFLKQYKSPAVGVKWFADYVDYQKELNRRVRESELKRFCVKHLDSFVYKFGSDTFFQIYEFIEGGHDLETILDKLRFNPTFLNWHQRTIIAKVMMAGIHKLHEQKIAHCDLKPPNLQMLKDASIEAGYQLKLIDMDFSVLSDRKAPWHGHAPYVGTPRYFSPEHLKGEVPSREADIFTCGLILYELLGEGHPYTAEDDSDYFEKVKAYKAKSPKLLGSLSEPDAIGYLADTMHRCLSPVPTARPSAREVNLALNGKRDLEEPPPEVAPPAVGSLRLSNNAGVSIVFNITNSVGKHLLGQFTRDARFADDHQFTLERRGLEWWLVPRSQTTNYTMLNNEPAATSCRLKSGDEIAIGGRTSGRKVLPLIVRL